MNDVDLDDRLIAVARGKAKVFFESLSTTGSEEEAIDALAKLLLDEGGTILRAAADRFVQAILTIYVREDRQAEGRDLLGKIHQEITSP
jgi:hypothetical protein